MRDREPPGRGDSLPALALLYVSGEMDAAEADDFERRLGEDQDAREAVCQAVQLNHDLAGLAPLAPNPDYRRNVHQRLLPRTGLAARLFGKQGYRGHPALWAVAGAAAAVLVMLTLPAPRSLALPETLDGVAAAPVEPPAAPAVAEKPEDKNAAMGSVWADLHRGDHVVRAADEGRTRRIRHEDRRPGRSEQRLTRFLGPVRMHN